MVRKEITAFKFLGNSYTTSVRLIAFQRLNLSWCTLMDLTVFILLALLGAFIGWHIAKREHTSTEGRLAGALAGAILLPLIASLISFVLMLLMPLVVAAITIVLAIALLRVLKRL